MLSRCNLCIIRFLFRWLNFWLLTISSQQLPGHWLTWVDKWSYTAGLTTSQLAQWVRSWFLVSEAVGSRPSKGDDDDDDDRSKCQLSSTRNTRQLYWWWHHSKPLNLKIQIAWTGPCAKAPNILRVTVDVLQIHIIILPQKLIFLFTVVSNLPTRQWMAYSICEATVELPLVN